MKKRRKNLTIGIWAMAASLAVQGTIPIYAAGKSEIDNSFVLISNQESMENSATEKLKAELGKNTFVESNLAIKPEAAWKFKTAFMNRNLSSQKATLSQAYREERGANEFYPGKFGTAIFCFHRRFMGGLGRRFLFSR